ncbi:UvrD-helicase domain-containing protein [Pseudonocardia kunmingensis]|uniref:RecBCD enzyme subunit RecB n=1 Tax=Pseudonocardia kunmingensis TaxID=630975 RepID=A0A543DN21_9PSEU|nr:UvrD-helicase domain-containing protein [Pseudonocardia kunmingensis]TQM10712.1 exodeoxyribonuclease V beta subunit [Pseudonocardia kunmingensis]
MTVIPFPTRSRARSASVLAPAPFDVCGPLPTATTVLEASAGTGKTFTIAALATRYVAEGHATLPELMLVTFGREATQELRERVRERLVSAERGLAAPEAARRGADDVLRLLADAPDAEVAARRARLARALTQFDAATIATTHQFCQQMLAGLGVAGDADRDAVFVESIEDVITEVVDDFYVRKYGARSAGPPAFSRAEALALARRAVHDGQARLEPRHAEPGSTAQVRHRFAAAVRAEVARRKRVRRIYTYDDMLTRLADALADPARGPAAAARLRARFRVVLVDEFQDTDPVQWQILREAFHGSTTLVLIGDPKQAIYAFRGADVVSYLEATEAADHHATLGRNWRSDAPLLAALDTVFSGAALGDPRITVHAVESAHPGSRLRGAPVDTPFRLRVAARAGLPRAPRRDLAVVGPARELVARDTAADIAELLASPATIDRRPIAPGDVAVLVRTNDQGAMIRNALAALGVPAVLSGTASVFGTPVAGEWLTLLEACEQPRAFRVRAAALTCFLGRTVAELCGPAADVLLDELAATLRGWAVVLRERGVAALLEAITTGTGLPGRVLASTDGERLLTDLRHVAQALHAAAVAEHLGPAALVDWLRHRIADAAQDVVVERSRRLESDAAAVQIITIHRSKGLEYPVVHVPFAWDRNVRDPDVPLLHDESGVRVLDVGGETGDGWKERVATHRAEEAGEDLRLLYVALTRAQCQVVTWWVPATTTATSPLHRLLVGRPAPGTDPAEAYRVPADAAAMAGLRELAGAHISVEEVGPRDAPAFAGATRPGGALRAAEFSRRLDTAWRRTSYSALTAAAHDAGPGSRPGVGSEPEEPGVDDEVAVELTDAAGAREGDERHPSAVASPMAEQPLGAGFGTLVHAIFEAADLTAPDLHGELAAHAREQLERHPAPGVEAEALAAALVPAACTPLGPLAGGLRLADIAPRDRLAELDFELPLAGGDTPGAPAALAALEPLLRHHLPADDPLHGYPDALAELAEQQLRGYLTGSIDAVLRLPGSRFAVVDYKTNWLGPVGPEGREPLTSAHYTPARLAEAMIGAHYPLQALLYSVALHRYLRWRLPGYAPEQHLGGTLYLFVRGMCGPETPIVDGMPCGVFGWSPPAALVAELSDLLDGGAA